MRVVHAQRPSIAYYRFLYNAVGKDYHWSTRGKMTDSELAALIQDPRDEVHVLHVDGVPGGFAELDRRKPDDIELVQFGLTLSILCGLLRVQRLDSQPWTSGRSRPHRI